MQESPKLLQTVLEWCTRNEQPMVGVELHQCFVQQRVIILQSMSLVHQKRGPTQRSQECLVLKYNLIRRQHRVEFESLLLIFARETPLVVTYLKN